MTKYKNIKGKEINVHCKPVKTDEVFEAKEDMEMEVLIREGYVKKIGGANDGGRKEEKGNMGIPKPVNNELTQSSC